jgi:hypothetical protein
MFLPPLHSHIPLKASKWVGTTPAAKSMPTTAIEDNRHDNEHNTKAPSNSSNCMQYKLCKSCAFE